MKVLSKLISVVILGAVSLFGQLDRSKSNAALRQIFGEILTIQKEV